MKVVIKYPENKVLKNKTRRLLKRNGIDFEKVTMIADINDKSLLMELEGLGNDIKKIETKTKENEKWKKEDIKYFMDFFQKNKGALILSTEDKQFFKDIVGRYKSA